MENTLTKHEEKAVEQQNEMKQMSRVIKPRVDIVERDDSFIVMADMAGVSAETIDITLERNVLTLHGTAATRDTMYQRAFTLSKKIDRDAIEAAVKHGVLTVTLPKAAAVVPEKKQIAVKAA